MSGRLHLDGLLGQQAIEPQLQADVVHRRGSARLTARVTPAPDGRWRSPRNCASPAGACCAPR
jgi:hypothetical protein